MTGWIKLNLILQMTTFEETDAKKDFFSIALTRQVVSRAIKVAVIVGTILAFINHGDKIFSLSLTSLGMMKVILTYLVPYSVSTWSAVRAIQANAEKYNE